jgi:predicted AlkP superfamily phosphohydrolase/phosphomutase
VPDARVFVASDHGFQATTEIFYVNVWLHQLGLLQWTEDGDFDDFGRLTADRLKDQLVQVDRARTDAYALTPSSNGIRIKVRQDDREAGVPPEQYEAFRRRLIDSLLAFTDPATRGRVVTRAQTREEAYPGPRSYLAPDLLLTLRDGGFVSVLNADAPLKLRLEPSGTHHPDGIFIAAGPGVLEGRVMSGLSILDVAPILLHSLGLPIPEDLEGHVPTQVFEPDWLQARPVRVGPPTRSPDSPATERRSASEDPEIEAEVRARLRALGYLE